MCKFLRKNSTLKLQYVTSVYYKYAFDAQSDYLCFEDGVVESCFPRRRGSQGPKNNVRFCGKWLGNTMYEIVPSLWLAARREQTVL